MGKIILFFLPLPFLLSAFVGAAPPPSGAVKFVILNPSDSTVGIPITVTVEARKQNNQIDANYQNDVTLVASGSATGAGLVDIVNGVGTIDVNDLVAETITLSLSDTEGTGLDVSSTQNVVFAVADAVSWNQRSFRFLDDDGAENAASGFGPSDVAADTRLVNFNENLFNRLKTFRLRISVKAGQAAGIIAPRLEFLEYDDREPIIPACGSESSWTAISANTNNSFSLRNSFNVANRSGTTQQLGGGAVNYKAGYILDEENPGPSITLQKNQVTEYEWSLQYNRDFSRSNTGPNFLFRISNNGTALNTYGVCPLVSLAAPYISKVSPTAVAISGKAYPGAEISVVEKGFRQDKLIAQGAEVSESGDFKIENIGIVQGDYAYSLIVKDREGRQTQTKVYNVDFVADSALIKDVFVSPTIEVVRPVVTKGDFLKVIGYASPKSKVKVRLENGIIYETSANDGGRYELLINTAYFAFGKYSLQVKQQDLETKKESDWSLSKTFAVSSLTVVEADLSRDGIIDIKDWSIFLTRWKAKDKSIDLNRDGKTDISDLSVFLRAFRNRK